MKQILTDIEGEIDENTVEVGDFNTLLTSMDRSSSQKTHRRDILNDKIEHQTQLMFSGQYIKKKKKKEKKKTTKNP